MRIGILGNGPSLMLDSSRYLDLDYLLITNRLIWEDFRNWNSSLKYVCSDQRFGNSPEWISEVLHNEIETFLSDELYNIIWDLYQGTRIISYSDLGSNSILKSFKIKFPLLQDFKANVVLDLGIPVALHLGATDIVLFGCDFDYMIWKTTDRPKYYSGYKARGANFEHSLGSARSWSDESNIRFQQMEDFLRNFGINLRNGN